MNSEKWMTGQGFVFSFVGPIENSNPDFQDLVFSYVYMLKYESILAWRIPRREEPGGLQYIGLQRVGHD